MVSGHHHWNWRWSLYYLFKFFRFFEWVGLKMSILKKCLNFHLKAIYLNINEIVSDIRIKGFEKPTWLLRFDLVT